MKKFEILGKLQLRLRVSKSSHLENYAKHYLELFFSYSRACFLHSLNIFIGMFKAGSGETNLEDS